jgi:hypothetical protein
MGREKRAAQSRAQDLMEKTGRSSDVMAGSPTAASVQPVHDDKPTTSTRKAIVQIILLYLVPILVVLLIGKLLLKL